ncbi:Uncharacterised protein [uncultured archaeon]|nr:Uncharacterised protein [uncultured archaeon]
MTNFPISIFCPFCQRHTSLTVASGRCLRSDNDSALAIWDVGDKRGTIWWIGICNYCKKPVLVCDNGDIYPNPLPSPTDERIPEPIKQDLNEAKICLSVKAYRGCAVMARRAMQTSCIDKGATKDKLVDQLQELASNGTITKDLKEWANVVRWVGNDAAHPNKENVSKEDAEDILNLSEQFLHVIYVAPAIAKEQKSKRGK